VRFAGSSQENLIVIRAYSYGRIFNERIQSIDQTAERYFTANCDQAMEAEYCELSSSSKKLSAIRNDISHGAVEVWKRKERVVGVFVSGLGDDDYRFCLVPAYYNRREQTFVSEGRFAFRPGYYLFSSQIREFGNDFAKLQRLVYDYTTKISRLIASLRHKPVSPT
jgi:hypothetical protein